MRGIRTVPHLWSICEYMLAVCPQAVMLQYVNPMAINTWAVAEKHPQIRQVGCHPPCKCGRAYQGGVNPGALTYFDIAMAPAPNPTDQTSDSTARAIGIDIGGGSTKIGLVDGTGTLLASHQVVVPADADFQIILSIYRNAIAALGAAYGSYPVGIAYPGHIDRRRGVGRNSNVPALDRHPLAAALGVDGRAAALLNDADAAAVAEARCHAEGLSGRIMMVTVGTGIGVAMVVDGVPLETAGGTLGDSGHIIVDPSAHFICRQGCRGCLESVASAEALARDATALARERSGTALSGELALGGTVSAAAVIRLAAGGDAPACELIAAMAEWLGVAVASWRAMFHPDLVVFGGGLSVLGTPFVDQIARHADRRALPFLSGCRYTIAELGNDAGMIGAGLVALKATELTGARHD